MATLFKQRGFISGNVGAGILFILLIVWILWFMSATQPASRIERVCRPAYWFGNIFVSIAELGQDPQAVLNVVRLRTQLDYGCRHVIWKQFYYEDWLKAKQALEQAKAAGRK